jgi:hypothetical protein
MRRGSGRWYSAFCPICLILTVAGCTSTPAAPLPSTTGQTPQAPPARSLAGMVLEPSGACIRGATVESIAGQAVGQRVVQPGPCDYWSYGGGGFTFTDLTPGVSVTLRASAPGFVTKEISNVGPGNLDILITLQPLPAQ